MKRAHVAAVCFLTASLFPQVVHAVSSAELYTATAYSYGRVETRLRFAAGDGIVSSFFLWKDGSEQAGMFWNELDFEKLGADCRLETNPIYGKPSANHSQRHALALDLCGTFHDYVYEWTPEAIVWRLDGQEIRRETGAAAQAFAENAGQTGMQIHLNLWPGDASFGGNFNPASLPVHQYVDWVQFSEYQNGAFELAWREDFEGSSLPAGWLTGTWASPKNRSTHASENVSFIDGYAVLSLTADDARGPAGAMPSQVASGGAKSDAGSGTGAVTNGTAGGEGVAGAGGASSASAGAGVTPPGTAPNAGALTCGVGTRSSGRPLGFGFAALAYLFARRRR